MKRIPLFAVSCALAFLFSSCKTESVNPLGAPEPAAADPRLEGEWSHVKEPMKRLSFTAAKAPWMQAVIVNLTDSNDSAYEVYPTTIGKAHFLNVVAFEKDADGQLKKSENYMFARYELAPDGTLSIWTINGALVAKAVKDGILKGKVENDSSDSGKNIKLSSSTLALFRYIQKTGAEKLFDQEFGVYRKASPLKPITVIANPSQLTLDGAPIKLDELETRLAEIKAKSGAEDPVLIRFAPETPVGLLLELRERGLKSHRLVHLIFQGPNQAAAFKELTVGDANARYLKPAPAAK